MKSTEITNNPLEGLCTSMVCAKNVPQHVTEVAYYANRIGESRATRMARLYPFGVCAAVPKILRDLLVASIDGLGVGFTLSDYCLNNSIRHIDESERHTGFDRVFLRKHRHRDSLAGPQCSTVAGLVMSHLVSVGQYPNGRHLDTCITINVTVKDGGVDLSGVLTHSKLDPDDDMIINAVSSDYREFTVSITEAFKKKIPPQYLEDGFDYLGLIQDPSEVVMDLLFSGYGLGEFTLHWNFHNKTLTIGLTVMDAVKTN